MPNASYCSPRFASLQSQVQVSTPKGHSSRKLQYAALQNLNRNSMIPQANAKFSPMNTNNMHFNDSPDQNKMQYPGLNFNELSPFNAKVRTDAVLGVSSPHVQN